MIRLCLLQLLPDPLTSPSTKKPTFFLSLRKKKKKRKQKQKTDNNNNQNKEKQGKKSQTKTQEILTDTETHTLINTEILYRHKIKNYNM